MSSLSNAGGPMLLEQVARTMRHATPCAACRAACHVPRHVPLRPTTFISSARATLPLAVTHHLHRIHHPRHSHRIHHPRHPQPHSPLSPPSSPSPPLPPSPPSPLSARSRVCKTSWALRRRPPPPSNSWRHPPQGPRLASRSSVSPSRWSTTSISGWRMRKPSHHTTHPQCPR